MKKLILPLLLLAVSLQAVAFTYKDGRASLAPYPTDRSVRVYPDTLHPVFVNLVARHGSRYPAGSLFTMMMKRALDRADSLRTITPLGKRLLGDVDRVIAATNGRWGQLDTIGEQEHRGIAARLYRSCPQLLDSARVVALSSSSPRSVMSMYSFTHQLAQMGKQVDITAMSGSRFSPLVRNFELDEEYKAYRADTAYLSTYGKFLAKNITIDPLLRVLGENYPLDYRGASDLAMAEYYVLAGMDAMGLDISPEPYFTLKEYRQLWSIFNFREYLLYSASTVSSRPAEIAAPLLLDLVQTADSVASGRLKTAAKLRFGHAETMMPLLALMQVPGCYYLTNYFDSVADNWQAYAIVPMACNLQIVLLRADSGLLYARVDLNEKPVRLLPDQQTDYALWSDLRVYLLERLPIE